MTREEILSIAKFVAFPTYDSYPPSYDDLPYDIVKFPIRPRSRYTLYIANGHHMTTEYHREYVYPKLAEMLDIPYDPEDFDIVPYTDELGRGFDLSYMRLKNADDLTLTSFVNDTECVIFDCTSDYIQGNDDRAELFPNAYLLRTNYHKLYILGHQPSRIVNHSIHNGRKLVISGDSMFIPVVPILSHYFEEVWMLDNRTGGSIYENTIPMSGWFKDVTFTDAIVEFWGSDVEIPLKVNLK